LPQAGRQGAARTGAQAPDDAPQTGTSMSSLRAKLPGWVYVLVVLAVLLLWELWPRSAPSVNPEALVSLESIVAFCESPEAAAQSDARCADVRYAADWCRTRGKGMCELDHFYDILANLGFNLPPLHGERR